MRPCQGHFQNSRKCDFLVYIFYSLFSCTHREVKSVPLLPAQPRAARHERRCRNPLAVLFRCGAERALMPAGSAHLFPRPRLLSALEGGGPCRASSAAPHADAAGSQPFPRVGAVTGSLAPRGGGKQLPRVTAAPAAAGRGLPVSSPWEAQPEAWRGARGPALAVGCTAASPPPTAPLQQCRPPLQPAWQERRLPASCPPLKLIPTCAIALINNSAVANYSLSSSLSSSLIPGKQRRLCTDRIVYFSTSFRSFCCSVSFF